MATNLGFDINLAALFLISLLTCNYEQLAWANPFIVGDFHPHGGDQIMTSDGNPIMPQHDTDLKKERKNLYNLINLEGNARNAV